MEVKHLACILILYVREYYSCKYRRLLICDFLQMNTPWGAAYSTVTGCAI